MKFLVGQTGQSTAVFIVNGEEAINITDLDDNVGSDRASLIASGITRNELQSLCADAPTVSVAGITPALPIARPGKVVCLGLNYMGHIKEGGRDIPDYPVFFMRGPTSLLPSGAPMVRPECSHTFDYEAELLVIIGKRGRRIREEDALDYVFGYTTFNDASVREYQRKSTQWTPGKNFDGTGAVGPIVVTPDELPPGAAGLGSASNVA